jgi:glycosyltransferase involved in cell wall biosynthesis
MKKYIILIPVYNDWKSVFKLLKEINFQVAKWNADVSILIMNDASTEACPTNELSLENLKLIRIMNMKKNQGHARCIATGLKFLFEKEKFDYVIVMDGDGEDRPEELNLLFNKSSENPNKVITANRIKRSEGLLFKFLYQCHKMITFAFTGRLIKFGNYSCLPRDAVSVLLKDASFWSSYSGSVAKIIKDHDHVPSIRGKRFVEPSQMNFIKLLVHSIAIMAVFKNSTIIRSALFLFFYLFFVFYNLSFITLFPVFVVALFQILIFKISSRENMEGLNDSLTNVGSIDVLTHLTSE